MFSAKSAGSRLSATYPIGGGNQNDTKNIPQNDTTIMNDTPIPIPPIWYHYGNIFLM